MVETLVIAGLIVLAAGAWIALGVHGRRSDARLEEQQEVDRALAALTMHVRRDVRSAVAHSRDADGTIRLRVLREGEEEVEVVYRKLPDGVERTAGREKMQWSFGGKEFVFDVRE